MKILHVAPIPAGRESGFAYSVLGLAEAQRTLGHDVALICSVRDGIPGRHVPDEVTVIRPDPRALRTPWPRETHLGSILSGVGPRDTVHFHGTYIPFHIGFARNCRREGRPYFHSPRGDLTRVAQTLKGVKKRVANTLFIQRYLDGASRLVALNECEAAELESFCERDRIAILPNGVPASLVKTGRRLTPPREGAGPLRLGFVGRLDVHIKGLDLLLSAMARVQATKGPGVIHLTLVGGYHTSDDKNRVQAAVRDLPHPHEVVFAGPLFDGAKVRALERMDLYVCSSRSEGMSMSVLEAMALGRPCLVTPGSRAKELILESGGGWTCLLSAEDLAASLAKIASSKEELRHRGSSAQMHVERHYTWPVIAERSVGIYASGYTSFSASSGITNDSPGGFRSGG